jgi:amino acid transporter
MQAEWGLSHENAQMGRCRIGARSAAVVSRITGVCTATQPRLRRALTLRDLFLYGIIVTSPVAPMSIYGIVSSRAHGHVSSIILIAMFAMLLTAVSYGRMARAYPSAGSAFSYVGQEFNPVAGYVVGWSLVLDYILNPLICIIWCSQQSHEFIATIPYWAWAILFAVLFTALNVQGIKTSARFNALLAVGIGCVVVVFLVACGIFVLHHPHQAPDFFTHPFYDPGTWNGMGVLGATSVAVLTYMGFDAVSTLAEEAENPAKILPATLLTCVGIGAISLLEVYAAQLVWGTTESFPNVDTAFSFVAGRAWSPLFIVLGSTLIVAQIGSGIAAQLGAARVLYGMGRSGALPSSFFGIVEPKRRVPRNNVVFVGVLALAAALILPLTARETTAYELAVNLVNFGALIAFMGVNAAAFMHFYVRTHTRRWIDLVSPVLGFLVCAVLWLSLSSASRWVGGVWMVAGILFGAWKTRGFRSNLVSFEVPPDTADVPAWPASDLQGTP